MVFMEGDIVLINGTPGWDPLTCHLWVGAMDRLLKDGREYEVISVYNKAPEPNRYALKDCLTDDPSQWVFPEGALVLI